jgi:hypothetical protein
MTPERVMRDEGWYVRPHCEKSAARTPAQIRVFAFALTSRPKIDSRERIDKCAIPKKFMTAPLKPGDARSITIGTGMVLNFLRELRQQDGARAEAHFTAPCAGSSRASMSFVPRKTWMAGTSPAMTPWCRRGLCRRAASKLCACTSRRIGTKGRRAFRAVIHAFDQTDVHTHVSTLDK